MLLTMLCRYSWISSPTNTLHKTNLAPTISLMNKPILGIFREHRDIEGFVFKAPHYQQAYHEIIDQLHAKGVYVAILMGQGSYRGSGEFSKHWVQIKKDGQYSYEKRGAIRIDALYDKDHFKTDGHLLMVNNQALHDLCWSKEKTYEVLGDFHPKTIEVKNVAELKDALGKMPGDKVALKELTGSSGKGVFVGQKTEATTTGLQFPLLVQEFIETSAGVPGITNKRHDVRVVLANGELIAATLRTPPEGGLKSNIGYGGENRLLNVTDLPAELLAICKKIDKRLQPYGIFRLYSVDFGLTPNGWRMFEANSTPGALNQGRGQPAMLYQEKLTNFLKQAAIAGQKENNHA